VHSPRLLLNSTSQRFYYREYEELWFRACNCGVRCTRTDYSTMVSYSAIATNGSSRQLHDMWQTDVAYVR
jgi:hypothetical protein